MVVESSSAMTPNPSAWCALSIVRRSRRLPPSMAVEAVTGVPSRSKSRVSDAAAAASEGERSGTGLTLAWSAGAPASFTPGATSSSSRSRSLAPRAVLGASAATRPIDASAHSEEHFGRASLIVGLRAAASRHRDAARRLVVRRDGVALVARAPHRVLHAAGDAGALDADLERERQPLGAVEVPRGVAAQRELHALGIGDVDEHALQAGVRVAVRGAVDRAR